MKSCVNPRMVINPKIIGYCLSDEKKEMLMNIAQEINTDISFVGTEYAGRYLGSVASINGVPGDSHDVENPPECEALVMSGLKETVMNRFLGLMKEREVQIDLKCIVTSSNQNWRMYQLIEELKKEHEKFKK